jgi:hypothetical protein
MLPKTFTNTELLVFEVVLHNEFTNEADRNQLNTHDDHCYTEQRERAVAERCSA